MGPYTNVRPLLSCHLHLKDGLDGARQNKDCKASKRTRLGHGYRIQRVVLKAVISRGAINHRASEHHSAYHTGHGHRRRQQLRCSAVAGTVDRSLMVKLSLAQTSNQLDLSECGLTSVPDDVLALTNLEVSYACNQLGTCGHFQCTFPSLRIPAKTWIRSGANVLPNVLIFDILQELSLAGNDLRELPDGLCKLEKLRKLQLSGNRLKSLPESLCCMPSLEVWHTALSYKCALLLSIRHVICSNDGSTILAVFDSR